MLSLKPAALGAAWISATAFADSGCRPRNACIFAGSGFPVAGSGLDVSNCSQKASGVLTGKTGKGIIAARHSSPLGSRNFSPRLGSDMCESAAKGDWPPEIPKRAITGTVASGAKTDALERPTPCPLLAKLPEAQRPLAWFRRNPGYTPSTSWKVSTRVCWVSLTRREPASRIGKGAGDNQHHDRDHAEAHQNRGCRQRWWRDLLARGLLIGRHGIA